MDAAKEGGLVRFHGRLEAMFLLFRQEKGIDRIRRETVWQELTDEHAASLPSEDKPVDEQVSELQRQARVQAVLKELPAEQVEVVTLAFIEGLAHGEIAERLSLPLGTVKSRLRLAYQKLRASLEDLR